MFVLSAATCLMVVAAGALVTSVVVFASLFAVGLVNRMALFGVACRVLFSLLVLAVVRRGVL